MPRSDAKGSTSFPNLTDGDWLYGGTPEIIAETIAKGRHGVMPPWKGVIDPRMAGDIAHYVRSLSGLAVDPVRVFRGKREFANYCVPATGWTARATRRWARPT